MWLIPTSLFEVLMDRLSQQVLFSAKTPEYWANSVARGSTLFSSFVGADSAGNLYSIAYTDGVAPNRTFVLKTLDDGSVVRTTDITSGLAATKGAFGAVDTSGNVAVADNRNSMATVTKLTSAGAVVWSRGSGGSSTNAAGVTIAPDGSIYATAVTNGSSYSPYWVKYDSAGTLLWGKQLPATASFFGVGGITATATGVAWAGASSIWGAVRGVVARIDPDTGNVLWAKIFLWSIPGEYYFRHFWDLRGGSIHR